MSRHNYSQYSNKNRNETPAVEVDTIETEITEVTETPVVDVVETAVPEIVTVEETVDTVTLPETVTGTVVNCGKLNVRTKPTPTAEVACVLDVNSEIKINVAKSVDDWFSVHTATGIEGYCMKQFVNANL